MPIFEKVRRLPGKIKAVDSLKNSAFRMFFLSRLFNALGMNTRQFSTVFLVYYLTDSAVWLGYLILARAIPMLVVSPLGGAMADRLEKKTLIQFSSIADILIATGIGLSLSLGYLSPGNPNSWWFLIAMAALDGTSTVFKGPSTDAMIIEIVGDKLVTNAIALNLAGQNTLRLIGPVLAGAVIDNFGYEPVFFSMAVIYAFSLLFMVFVPYTGKRNINADSNIFSDIRDVINYMGKERNILFVLVVVLGMVFFSMPYQQLLPVFQGIIKVSTTQMGVLQLMSGLGSIGGAIVLASLPGNKKRGLLMIISGLILGISLVFFSFSTIWVVSLVMMIGVGLGQSGRMTLPVALLQTYSKPEYRARVMSFYGMEFGLSSFGSFFAAVLVAAIGVQWSVGGMALLLVALTLAVLIFLPRLRKLD